MKQITHFPMRSEIIRTAKVWTVISNVVSNAKRAPNPQRTKCVSIAKVRKWEDTYLRYGFFLPDDKILNVAVTLQKCKNNQCSIFG